MTDLQNLFLAAYPLFPKQLIEKFDSLLSFEVAKFNPAINQDIVAIYSRLANPVKNNIQKWVDNFSYALNPQNARYLKTAYYGPEFVRVYNAKTVNFEMFFDENLISENVKFFGKIQYDNRIYQSAQITIEKESILTGSRYPISYLSFMSYSSALVESVSENVLSVFYGVLQKYDGAKTVLAMIENGVDAKCDKALLSEFVTFLNAYSKYGAQLGADKNLQAEKNAQQIADYKKELSDKLTARKNDLQDFKTQISFAAKNELASAKRDMQNLSLSAQNLLLTMQEKLT